MKSGFSEQEQEHIYRAKAILKQLWKASGLSQRDVLKCLSERGLSTTQSSLSTWLSTKKGNYFRPKQDHLEVLLELFCPTEQLQETRDEIHILLGYSQGPLTPESIKNKVAQQINVNMEGTLRSNQVRLKSDLALLDGLLDEVEPLIFEYDKGYPVIFVEQENRKLLWQLLGRDKTLHKKYAVESGYEVPFSQIRCQDTVTQIINNLNESIRLVQAYIDRHITEEEEGLLLFDFYRIEDFVSYAWEIADRLLYNNALCKAVPLLKRTLLRVMTVAWGIKYILENQNRSSTSTQFRNVLELKGKALTADINCSVAVYTGMLARQMLRSPSLDKAKQGLKFFDEASKALKDCHHKVQSQQDVFFYKKEMANLCYDVANYLLHHQERLPKNQRRFKSIMKQAYENYAQIMNTPNVFIDGLSAERATHIQLFYMISAAWSLPQESAIVKIINMLNSGQLLNERYWKIQIARAIAYGVLALRFEKQRDTYQAAAGSALEHARLVEGCRAKTQHEIDNEYVLHKLFQNH